MTKDEIELVEKQLKLCLPVDYKNVLINYPRCLESDDIFKAYYYNLINHSTILIEENNKNIEEIFDEEEQRKYFLIGIDACGGFYFINLDVNPSPVYYYDHETDDYDIFSVNIYEYVRSVIELQEDLKDD